MLMYVIVFYCANMLPKYSVKYTVVVFSRIWIFIYS